MSDDEKLLRPCRYIDEAHLEVGNNLYHMREFAERMGRMSILPSTGKPIILKLGEQGYTFSTLENERALVSCTIKESQPGGIYSRPVGF